ncbi:hypothetical protein HPP92_015961 [Vanilla planifolia]|uniref:Plantacyanin n=1 Tax=Vanilla planifolia TaxID=51239 RepID=A0A835USW7_VANPL|nr:hypothetical protein HPP92_015961 [Vanilla planifolia]
MAQARGSARSAMALLLALLLVMLLHGQVAESAIYTVGGTGGWGFNPGSWFNGKRFRAGDALVFKYNPSVHNVVAVDALSYRNCKTPRGAKVYRSGNDRITLARGANYFICNFPGHCEAGMKVAVKAA